MNKKDDPLVSSKVKSRPEVQDSVDAIIYKEMNDSVDVKNIIALQARKSTV
ncbi:hypothetical protein MK805_06315 [Shimazuella sp. AN120528]|uniref:hypothetical protein n=1 Tax=Shimazuella soli TaxID=1892854 RepID=UPI001F0DF123|nr:hypothetical protein [Shimazuella soli]MCH5584582.1 hypothetical protein [Shimazuella soli]